MGTYVIKIFLNGSKNEKLKFFIVLPLKKTVLMQSEKTLKCFNCIHNVFFFKLSI